MQTWSGVRVMEAARDVYRGVGPDQGLVAEEDRERVAGRGARRRCSAGQARRPALPMCMLVMCVHVHNGGSEFPMFQ